MISLANLARKEIKKLVLYDDGINSKQMYLQNSGTYQHRKWKSKVWWRWVAGAGGDLTSQSKGETSNY